jgi:hypothetical protein
MLTWRSILNKSWGSALRGSRLAKAAHILLLFAMVEPCWAIMCCILQVLCHLVVFGIVFTMNLAHEQVFCCYLQSIGAHKSDSVALYNSFGMLSHSVWGPGSQALAYP